MVEFLSKKDFKNIFKLFSAIFDAFAAVIISAIAGIGMFFLTSGVLYYTLPKTLVYSMILTASACGWTSILVFRKWQGEGEEN